MSAWHRNRLRRIYQRVHKLPYCSFVIFLLIKAVNKAQNLGNKIAKKEKEEEKPVPTCPFCLGEVKEGATRCPHCAGAFAGLAKSE